MQKHSTVREEPATAWCYAETRAVYAQLFPSLRWSTLAGDQQSVASMIVSELEMRRTTLSLSPISLEHIPELAREGWIRPLDSWFTPEQLAVYAPQALDLATVNGRLYALPDDITPFVFFVRRDVLKRLNMDPPRTWEEFEAFGSALAARRKSLVMLAGGQRFRMGFMLALLGSNGVVPRDNDHLLKDTIRAAEAYDWLRHMALDGQALSLDSLLHPKSHGAIDLLRGAAAGFGWLSYFHPLPASTLRRYEFLPFPRGPSLRPGEAPCRPLKGSGWCMPWSSSTSVNEVVAVLRAIHAPATLSAVKNVERFPYTAMRTRWDDPAVLRRYPLYRHAASLIDGVVAVPSIGLAHYRRMDLTFRNALMDGRDGQGWMDDYSGRDGLQSTGGNPLPIRTVLRAIESRLHQAHGIGDIARSLGLHPVRLRRLLRQELNQQGGTYFRKRRLEVAHARLAAGGISVKQVAAEVGYRNASAFSRAYRQCYGYAPSASATAARERTGACPP